MKNKKFNKHKKEHCWVIVKNGVALMTYEWEAFFFTDSSEGYYNKVSNDCLDIWTLQFSTKLYAEEWLKTNKYLAEKYLSPEGYSKEDIDYYGNGEEDNMPGYAESLDDAYVLKVYNHPYAHTRKKYRKN